MAAALSISTLLLAPAARADVDTTGYYKDLKGDGFLVNNENSSYFLNLAMIVCDMKNAGYEDDDIGHFIAKRENLTNIQGYDIFADAYSNICSQLHPRLVPFTPPPSTTPFRLPPGYRDGD